MLIASKMEEIYPLKVKTVFDKIAHRKIPMSELIGMEAKISQVLGFELTTFTVYDLACLKLIDYLIKEDLYDSLCTSMKEIEDVLAYLGKHLVYNYDLICQYDKNIQAKALCSLVLDAFKINVEERDDRSRFDG